MIGVADNRPNVRPTVVPSALCGAPHKADYVDTPIMWSRCANREPTAGMERLTRISCST